MAKKKSRTPPPPRPVRPVQAPKVRHDPRRQRVGTFGLPPPGPDRTRRLALMGGIGVAVIAVPVVLALVLGGGGSANAGGGIGGCIATTYPNLGRSHAITLPKGFKYNSFPPTSGTHYPVPLIFNIYDQPLQQFHLVHNLEHGGVAIQYGKDVPQSTVNQITQWYGSDTWGKIVAPLPALGSRVALTAWAHELSCPGFVQSAFDKFVSAYRDKGPESASLSKSRLNQGAN